MWWSNKIKAVGPLLDVNIVLHKELWNNHFNEITDFVDEIYKYFMRETGLRDKSLRFPLVIGAEC